MDGLEGMLDNNYHLTRPGLLGGRPRGLFSAMTAPRAKISPPTGDEAGAIAALAGALTLACPQGHIRVFADGGPPMAALLRRLVAAQRTGQVAARDSVRPGIVDPLTSRELADRLTASATLPHPT